MDGIAHDELGSSDIESDGEIVSAGDRSRIYNQSDITEMESAHDGRRKQVLINRQLVPDAGELLVDIVTYGPAVSCPRHYHDDTNHFFYILEGEGVLEVDGEEFDISKGTVAWIGEGDPHRLYAREGQEMKVFEYFSNSEHDTEWLDGHACTWQPE